MFDTETISLWRRTLHDDSLVVRHEALKVLGFALNHSMCLFLVGVRAHSGTDDVRRRIFDCRMMSELRSNLVAPVSWNIVEEVLVVLRLAIHHSALPLLEFPLRACVHAHRETDDLRGWIFEVATNSAIRICADQSHDKNVQAEATRLLGFIQALTRWPFSVPHALRPVALMAC